MPSDAEIIKSWMTEALDEGKQSGKSASDLAKLCGVSPQAVSGWKRTGRMTKANVEIAKRYFGYGPAFSKADLDELEKGVAEASNQFLNSKAKSEWPRTTKALLSLAREMEDRGEPFSATYWASRLRDMAQASLAEVGGSRVTSEAFEYLVQLLSRYLVAVIDGIPQKERQRNAAAQLAAPLAHALLEHDQEFVRSFLGALGVADDQVAVQVANALKPARPES